MKRFLFVMAFGLFVGACSMVTVLPVLTVCIEYIKADICQKQWASEETCIGWSIKTIVVNPDAYLREQ